eukprot:TRINITY_DN8275_c0_g1_i1.p1 TRINITY_DN8275_c0_g1~~TRINITY_DN8275_c0_g1_i1.p1  ORF type:complete len:603 (+),score=120.75 TRINITY_DN8275_c0_g1_i1:82-1890(+)
MSFQQLIPLINKLQDVFQTVGIEQMDLPQIAVVGSQSSGKSSVLENLVGRDFLPRGSGIVTRRPLVLQLINPNTLNESETTVEDWGEFNHLPNKIFRNFQDIRDEIVRETDRVAGRDKNINPTPIYLKIHSQSVLNLTLIDLPGITKVPVGDQPGDIERQIRRMILSYIEKPNCIILAVHAANTDLATSDSLKLASQVDPQGKRTVGVLTKIDLMDKGTDCLEILQGKVYNLQLGFIGVVNRSQEDINRAKPIRDALDYESQFFKSHHAYRNLREGCGTLHLARSLNRILVKHIRDCLPDLKTRISSLVLDTEHQLSNYGEPMSESKSEQGALILQILTKFSENFKRAIEGVSPSICSDHLIGGARIHHIFYEWFGSNIMKMTGTDGLTEEEIMASIRNAKGTQASLFVPEAAFDLLAKRQITQLEEPSLRCADYVYEELRRIVQENVVPKAERFPKLIESVKETCETLLRLALSPTRKMISDLIKAEVAFINKNHPDFLPDGRAYVALLAQFAGQQAAAMAAEANTPQQRPAAESAVDKRPHGSYSAPIHNTMDTPRPRENHDQSGNSNSNGGSGLSGLMGWTFAGFVLCAFLLFLPPAAF